jgi:hypothetical protein
MSGDHRQGHQPRACDAYLKIYVSDLSQIHGSFVLRPPPPRAGRRPRRMRGWRPAGHPHMAVVVWAVGRPAPLVAGCLRTPTPMAHLQRARQLRAAAVCLIGSARSIILAVAAAAAAAAAVGGDETPIHDPSGIVIEGAHAFIFSTSYMPEGGIELRRANYTGRGDADLEHVVWEKHTTVFPAGASPAWVHHRVPQVPLCHSILCARCFGCRTHPPTHRCT